MEISEILQAIQEAGPEDMSDLVNTLSRRYRQLYPDWDILYIACPKNNPEEKRVILDYIVRYFEKDW